MLNRDGPKYVILGAGISGLTLAWFLKKENPNASITLLEKEKEIGGWIRTDHENNFLFERGPHSLRLTPPYDKICYELFEDLALTAKIITPDSSAKKKYLSYGNKLHAIGLHPLKLLAPHNFLKLTWPILKGLMQKQNPENFDEDISSFFRRYFGEYATHQFVNPFVMGIKGGEIDRLSLKSCFPLLDKLSRKEKPLLIELIRHLKKSPTKLLSFKNGFSDLINAFNQTLDAEVLLNTEALEINCHPKPTVITKDQQIECDHIFSSLNAQALAGIFKSNNLDSSHFLSEQKSISYKIVHLGFNQALKIPKAFGFISPSWSHQAISGAVFDSKIFPTQNKKGDQTRLTLMIHQNSPLFDKSDDLLKEGVLKELQTLLKITARPNYYKLYHLKDAIPQYHVGHEEQLNAFKAEVRNKFPNFSFLGNSFYGLSVPSCIYNAHRMAVSHKKPKAYALTH